MDSKLQQLVESDPDAAAKLLLELQEKVVIPHDGGQREIMENHARFQIVCCGRRFGKTVIGAKKALLRCRRPKQMVWWCAPTYKVVKRGYREVLRQLPDDVLTHPPQLDSAFDAGRSVILKFKNGSRMEFYSAERPEAMLGEGVDFVVLDEAATMPKGVWETIVRPTLMDREGSALMISTPRGRNWFYYLWLRGQDDAKPLYRSWKFPTSSNPFIPDEEVREMADSMPLLTYQQEVEADFISSAGAVFRFHDDIVVSKTKPKGRVIIGVDLAKSNDFTVFSAASCDDMMPCGYDRFNEIAWKMQRARLRNFVKQLLAEGATHVTLVIDSTGLGDPIVEEMEADGYDVVPINFTKTKQHMVVQLSKDMEQGVVRLDYEEPLHEFENYTYKITDAGRWTYGAPEGQHDDAVSAKMLQHWGIVKEGAPNITAIAADDAVSQAEERKETETEDFVDIYEEQLDTGLPTHTTIEADTTAMLMGRRQAWTGSEMGRI
jgi:phage FluMu gp28-like protein